jgi:two-component system response regulator AtoC
MGKRDMAVLYVDDEVDNLELFRLQFGRDFDLRTASSGDEGLAILARGDVGVVLTDERMPRMTGIDLLARAVVCSPDTTRIIVSAYSDAPRLLLAINRGHAHEYVVKPWDRDDMADCIERGLRIAARRRALVTRAEMADALARDTVEHYDTSHVIGDAGGLRSVVAMATRAAQSDATVMIIGETGTGKELIARVIHQASLRAAGPFIRVNCAALAEGVLESELFGHEQGAFTGAHKLRQGRFELAHGGTIFLDEIGDVSPKLQASLLRVLQDREIERVGRSTPIAVDVRVVAATHRDLARRVRESTFREDLYYRLHVVPLRVPPLRERKDDIAPLVSHFLHKHARRAGVPMTASPAALQRLRAYAWPGNVRELENLVQRAVVLAEGPELTPEDFSFSIDVPDEAPDRGDVRAQVRGSEAEELRRLLLEHAGNCSRVARALGVPRTTIVSRAKKYGLLA